MKVRDKKTCLRVWLVWPVPKPLCLYTMEVQLWAAIKRQLQEKCTCPHRSTPGGSFPSFFWGENKYDHGVKACSWLLKSATWASHWKEMYVPLWYFNISMLFHHSLTISQCLLSSSILSSIQKKKKKEKNSVNWANHPDLPNTFGSTVIRT